jgi:hypothetical protein
MADKVQDSGGRRSNVERRKFSYTTHFPERRSGKDRRSGLDRRKNLKKDLRTEAGATSNDLRLPNISHELKS